MCGICGIYGNVSVEVLMSMCDAIAHRGPDDSGVFFARPVALGMTRLAIIDVAGGHQPMTNEDGRVVVVFNGEIYNYRELREELQQQGHRFKTNSDTEVLVHLYERYGAACVSKLRGIFAFAIADDEGLFIARDRLGVKPLYYTWARDTLYFASEIKSLLVCPAVKRELDAEALDDYLTFQYVPGPKTMFQGIFKLPPGHWLRVKRAGFWVSRYWELPLPEARGRGGVGQQSILDLLTEAVRLRTIADVPFGALLSGGLDSSLVVALLARVHPERVQAFHITFEGEPGETAYARQVAVHTGCEYHEVQAGPKELAVLPQVIWHLDEPIADAAAWATFLICRYARKFVKVLITGEGGDELFAGYPRYLLHKAAGYFHVLPQVFKRPVRSLANSLDKAFPGTFWKYVAKVAASPADPVRRNIAWLSIFDEATKDVLYAPGFASTINGRRAEMLFENLMRRYARGPLVALTATDMKTWLPDDILTKVDKTSMAWGIEARVPILDHVVVETVATLSDRDRWGIGVPKLLLRRVARSLLPREVIRRRKRAFLTPVAKWLRQYEPEWLIETLLSSRALGRGYFNAAFVRELVQRYLTDGTGGSWVWLLFCFELWCREFIDRMPSRRAPAVKICASLL